MACIYISVKGSILVCIPGRIYAFICPSNRVASILVGMWQVIKVLSAPLQASHLNGPIPCLLDHGVLHQGQLPCWAMILLIWLWKTISTKSNPLSSCRSWRVKMFLTYEFVDHYYQLHRFTMNLVQCWVILTSASTWTASSSTPWPSSAARLRSMSEKHLTFSSIIAVL